MWCRLSFLSPTAPTVFSLLMLCKLFCLCAGFAWPSSSAVGTLTGRRSCINRLYCVQAAGRKKGARVFLGQGWQSKAFSPWLIQKRSFLFLGWRRVQAFPNQTQWMSYFVHIYIFFWTYIFIFVCFCRIGLANYEFIFLNYITSSFFILSHSLF